MMYWYAIGRDKREELGLAGRNWLMNEGGLSAESMCQKMSEGLDGMLANWKGREKFNIHRHDEHVGHQMPNNELGFILPKISKDAVIEKFNK